MIKAMYRDLDNWLVDHNCDIKASEIQGLLSGLMAANIQIQPDEFVTHLIEYAGLQPAQLAEIYEKLMILLATLYESWTGIAVDFELLLPDDDELIDERADALGAWCTAFLVGFGLSGQPTKHSEFSPDVRSALEDLSEIAQVEIGERDDTLEKAFSDVSEHVRLSAVLVATEFFKPGSADDQGSLIH